jgi:thiol-disulfide isomerase/thioredoxin
VEAKKKIDEQKERGLYETDGEYEQAVSWYTSIMYDALGWVFFKEGRFAEAEVELLHAYELYHESPTVSHHLGQLYQAGYEGIGEGEEALARADSLWRMAENYYLKGTMAQAPGENPNREALEALYMERHGSDDGFEEYLADALDSDRATRRAEILDERIAEPEAMAPFDLRDLSGARMASAEILGKVIVINFWGTWCGPCVQEMPDYQELFDKYQGDEGVAILTINNDANPDVVKTWMDRKSFSFPVLLDDGYVGREGVHGFPTTWFVDSQGRVSFEKVGWSEALLEEFSWRVEALRGIS